MQLRAETALCQWAGYGTLHEAIDIYSDQPSAVGGDSQKASTVRHSTLRAVLVIERCPVTAEKAFSANPVATDEWLSSVTQILGPYLSEGPGNHGIDTLARRIACTKNTPHVCKVKKILLEHRSDVDLKEGSEEPEAGVGHILVAEAATEFVNSTGDFVTPMDNLAFLLVSCPGAFFGYMHEHPKELDYWLRTAQDNIFWGEPRDKGILNEYKTELTGFVEQTPTPYIAEKGKILKCLKTASESVTQ